MYLWQFTLISKQQLATLFFPDPKMYVISYCQIYSFHPSLYKIVIFKSFQQQPNEIYDMSHFKKEHEPFFDKTTFCQLKDAADAVLAWQKATSLAELLSVELKFTVDTLNKWVSVANQIYIKENPIDRLKTTFSICGFLLDANNGEWIDFIVRCEHLFLRNNYSFDEL